MRAPDTILPLRAEGLGFSAGVIAILSDVSLTLEAGSPSIIVGPNGAGKSVLLRLLHGLLAPSTGRVLWAGDAARRQAMVFQRPVLLRRSVLANAVYPLKLAGVAAAEREPRARAALEMVGLAALADRPARRLSGGEQQRLALARAAALSPEVLFLDEPCASLDPTATRAVEEIVGTLAARGTKIVMTTHDLGQARRLAGEVLFLNRGRLREQTPAAAFFNQPATPEAAAFLRGELVW
ncbi:MAG: ATP-binding cassette domain-containing protein [Roseomonas sp.]|jgi:tungstate transport system ATP-binding protein|nr:ATP-binding cassette domain-containing protein [Roseomonas sp.]MCA3584158.1 ATP-binding cassette domain-containing protein [Methylocystis sp.]MCA3333025.1 ATP-binding cassette domain-containing protein [Roseomonas sp.]MCA3335731.1 ATP-binding cassette domain-containing protein [Roseomonas sp.]MCA3348381.1 ATP-binding cassette domain-containing protein [Roseomonas sp.]